MLSLSLAALALSFLAHPSSAANCLSDALNEHPSIENYRQTVQQLASDPLIRTLNLDRPSEYPKNFVNKPVDGLYDSIPGRSTPRSRSTKFFLPPGYVAETSQKGDLTDTVITRAEGTEHAANFDCTINRPESALGVSATYIYDQNLPSFVQIPGVVDLVKGRGIPTTVFFILHQMRLAKIGYGRLRHAGESEIHNARTLLEIMGAPQVKQWISQHPKQAIPDEILSQVILNTQTGRILTTLLTQSGHRIVRVKVSPRQNIHLRGVFADYVKDSNIEDPKTDPIIRRALISKNLETASIDAKPIFYDGDQPTPYRLSIYLELAPWR